MRIIIFLTSFLLYQPLGKAMNMLMVFLKIYKNIKSN